MEAFLIFGGRKNMNKILLASTSPRRSEILTNLNIPFTTISPIFEEIIPPNRETLDIPEYFAREKALSVLPIIQQEHKNSIILGVDTMVVCDNIIYGKPKNIEEARNTLTMISGKKHTIISGIAAYNQLTKKMISKTSINSIKIAKLTEDDIQWYLSKNEWIDAAGSYKIQGSFQRYIIELNGSFSSVMGLPIFELYDILKMHGWVFT